MVGVDGILDAYRKALKVVHLHGPTMFSEVNETSIRIRNYSSVDDTVGIELGQAVQC